jgi:hypothetical protein
VFRFNVKWREERSPLMSIPPLWGGDFQGMRVYRSDVSFGKSAKSEFPRSHNIVSMSPTKLSLSMVASLQGPLPFHLADSVYLAWLTPPAGVVFAAAGVPLPTYGHAPYGSLPGGLPACPPT